MSKKLMFGLLAAVLVVLVTLTACDKDDLENIQVYQYVVDCSNSDLKSQYGSAVKNATDKGYADHDRDAEVIDACNAIYAEHAKLEQWRTVESCEVVVKRKYVSLTEGTGATHVVTYTYPIK